MVYCRFNNYFTFITREKNLLFFNLLFLLLLSEKRLSPGSSLAVAMRGQFAYNRSSRRRCSLKKGVLRNFAKFTGKHLCQRLFFNREKKRLWHRCFPVNFVKFLRTTFLQNTSGGCFCYKPVAHKKQI